LNAVPPLFALRSREKGLCVFQTEHLRANGRTRHSLHSWFSLLLQDGNSHINRASPFHLPGPLCSADLQLL